MGIAIAILLGGLYLLSGADFNHELKFLCQKLLADFCYNLNTATSQIIKIYGRKPSGNIKGPQTGWLTDAESTLKDGSRVV